MTEFERDQTSLIDKEISEQTQLPTIGIVTQVYEHAVYDDDSNWEVDVEMYAGTKSETRVPVHSGGNDMIAAPKNGDKILIIYTDGNTKSPVAFGTGNSNLDRPPIGRAGIYRNRFGSGVSPAGAGSLYINGYTSYDGDVASTDKRELNAEESFIQIAKHRFDANADLSDKEDLPAKIEFYDSPKNDESWISVEINKEGGQDSGSTWGIKFNIKTGEWKLVGPKGFGIMSDGEGNFTWEYKTIDFDQKDGNTGTFSL